MSGLSRATATEAGAASVIDEDHLGRMTLGDRRLEREVLENLCPSGRADAGPYQVCEA